MRLPFTYLDFFCKHSAGMRAQEGHGNMHHGSCRIQKEGLEVGWSLHGLTSNISAVLQWGWSPWKAWEQSVPVMANKTSARAGCLWQVVALFQGFMNLKKEGYWKERGVLYVSVKSSLKEIYYCVWKKRRLLWSKGAEVPAKVSNTIQSLLTLYKETTQLN